MNSREVDFFIRKDNFARALEAIKLLAEKQEKYDWVDSSEFRNSPTLADALGKWRWDAEINKDGDIDNICFRGQKIGSDEVLFNAIAPFVEDGSYIEMQGEDGVMWRWVFEDGVCKEKNATITWD